MVAVIIKGVVGKERFLILDAKGSAATRQGGGLPGGSYGSLGSSKSKPGTMVVSGYSVGGMPLSGRFCE